MYYYNKNEVDSVSKLVNYVKPIAERMEFFRLYFNAQKLLIYTYTYKEKYEYAINESLKMLEKAEELNNTDGRIAAYSCLASAYHETNRTKEEGEALRKAHKYVSFFGTKFFTTVMDKIATSNNTAAVMHFCLIKFILITFFPSRFLYYFTLISCYYIFQDVI